MKKKAVIYTRVSDPSQIDNNSLATQQKACEIAAESKGYEVVRVYVEEGKSAKHIQGRPELKELLSYCCSKKNKISAVFVYNFTRFSRNAEEGLMTISYLSKYGARVISATENLQEDPMGRAMRTIMLSLGQLDNEMKGEAVKHNMQAVFRKGLWPFKSPVGYRRKYKTKEQNRGLPPIKDENLTPIIKNMFNKAAEGIYNKSQLARMMNLEGFRDHYKSKASHKIVKKILEKTFYYGHMYAQKWDEYAWGKHEPMIDKETWDKAYQYVIMKKKNYSFKDEKIYPLKGIIRCELCDHAMTTCPSKGRKDIYYYYECGSRDCRKTRIRVNDAHDQFVGILKEIKPSKIALKLFNHAVFSEWDSVINQAKKGAKKIEQRISDLKAELKSIRKAKDDGTYTLDEAKEEAARIRIEIRVAEIERSDTRLEQYDQEIVKEFVKQFLLNLDRLWEELDLVKKQVLQERIFIDGIVCSKGKIRTTTLSPSFGLIQELNKSDSTIVTPPGIEPGLTE